MQHILLLSLLLLGAPSFAAEGDRIEITTLDLPAHYESLSAEEQRDFLKRLVHDAEEASEGGESEDKPKNKAVAFIQEYGSKANIPKVALGMYRWYNVMEGKYPSLAADLSVMLLASHTVEMLSGPIGVTWAAAAGAPGWAQWLIGVVGGVISVPGLDPLCIALGACYVKFPKFRNGVTQTRIFLMKGVSAVGIDRMLNWFVQKRSRVEFIQKALQSDPGKYTYLVQPEDGEPGLDYEFRNPQGQTFARVKFKQDTTVAAEQIQFFPEAAETVSSSEFAQMLTLFNFNVSKALSGAYKAFKTGKLKKLGSEYHVAEIVDHEIRFRPKALKLTDKRSWSEGFLSWFRCNDGMSEQNP